MRKLGKLLLVAMIATAGVLAWIWALSGERPEGPVPIVWDKTACASCRMHIGEPAFAAQLQTTDGRVLDFDDPGCLMEYVLAERPAIDSAYFRHVEHDRWLRLDEVGFVPHSHTPMGYGFAAVEKSRQDALSLDRAIDRVKERRHAVRRKP